MPESHLDRLTSWEAGPGWRDAVIAAAAIIAVIQGWPARAAERLSFASLPARAKAGWHQFQSRSSRLDDAVS